MKESIKVKSKNDCEDNNNICGEDYTNDESGLTTGSPLQNIHKEFYLMFSIVGVRRDGLVGMSYTKVFPFIDWIENIVWSDEE